MTKLRPLLVPTALLVLALQVAPAATLPGAQGLDLKPLDAAGRREGQAGQQDQAPAKDQPGILEGRDVAEPARQVPGLAVAEMVEAIVKDKHKILPCAAYLEGEYGLSDTYAGVPIQLGRTGMEKIVEIELTDDEQAAFQASAGAVKELIEMIPV